MRPSAAKAGHRLDGFTYGLKPVPFRMFLGGKFFQRSFDGLRPSFRPMYAQANMGHPSRRRGLRFDGQPSLDKRRAMADDVMVKENAMKTPVDTVRDFYAAIAAGDTGKMVGLMAPDIEWISVVDFNIQDRGSEEVMRKVFVPLMQEWESFSPSPSEFLVDGSTVVSLGRFACVHRATHKRADLAYAHVWDIQDGKIERHRQYIDTLALERVRRP